MYSCFFQLGILLSVYSIQSNRACTYGELRFFNRSFDGLVEICINNTWGTICNDGWTNINAQVVCRQLEHDRFIDYIGALYRPSSLYYGQGNGSIFLDDVKCVGTESKLLDCSHAAIGKHNCDHSQDVGVICLGSHRPAGTIVLSRNNIDSKSYTFGTIRFYHRQWGNICYDAFYGSNEANVICHQLGYTGASSYSRAGLVRYGIDMLPMLLSNLRCANKQFLSISQCSYSSIINSECVNDTFDATVSCYTSKIWDTILFPGTIRLQKGAYSNQGLVEVYCNGHWGTICNSGVSNTDATTLCRQLGYDRSSQINHLALTGNPGQPIWNINMTSYSGDTCFNTRNSCPSMSFSDCPHARDVTISCTEGSIRLSVTARTCDNSSILSLSSLAAPSTSSALKSPLINSTPFVIASSTIFHNGTSSSQSFFQSTVPSPNSRSSIIGSIIGGSIAGVAILIATIMVCLFCCYYFIKKLIATGKRHLQQINVKCHSAQGNDVINSTAPEMQYAAQYPPGAHFLQEESCLYSQEYPLQFVPLTEAPQYPYIAAQQIR